MRQFYGRPENAFFLQGKPMSIKFLVLGGGVFWVFRGGVPILFLWRADFSDFLPRWCTVILVLVHHPKT